MTTTIIGIDNLNSAVIAEKLFYGDDIIIWAADLPERQPKTYYKKLTDSGLIDYKNNIPYANQPITVFYGSDTLKINHTDIGQNANIQ